MARVFHLPWTGKQQIKAVSGVNVLIYIYIHIYEYSTASLYIYIYIYNLALARHVYYALSSDNLE